MGWLKSVSGRLFNRFSWPGWTGAGIWILTQIPDWDARWEYWEKTLTGLPSLIGSVLTSPYFGTGLIIFSVIWLIIVAPRLERARPVSAFSAPTSRTSEPDSHQFAELKGAISEVKPPLAALCRLQWLDRKWQEFERLRKATETQWEAVQSDLKRPATMAPSAGRAPGRWLQSLNAMQTFFEQCSGQKYDFETLRTKPLPEQHNEATYKIREMQSWLQGEITVAQRAIAKYLEDTGGAPRAK